MANIKWLNLYAFKNQKQLWHTMTSINAPSKWKHISAKVVSADKDTLNHDVDQVCEGEAAMNACAMG